MYISKIEKLAVTTSAQNVAVNGRYFLLQNLDDAKAVYFREKEYDNKACTVSNGFRLKAGETLDVPIGAGTLSIIGEGNADVRIMYLNDV